MEKRVDFIRGSNLPASSEVVLLIKTVQKDFRNNVEQNILVCDKTSVQTVFSDGDP